MPLAAIPVAKLLAPHWVGGAARAVAVAALPPMLRLVAVPALMLAAVRLVRLAPETAPNDPLQVPLVMVPTLVSDDDTTLLASVVPVSVPAAAGAATAVLVGWQLLPSHLHSQSVSALAAVLTAGALMTFVGQTKARPPVPSCRMVNSNTSPGVAFWRVEPVTLPVRVISCVFPSEPSKTGVAENVTGLTLAAILRGWTAAVPVGVSVMPLFAPAALMLIAPGDAKLVTAVIDVMSALAPLAAAPKLVRAAPAVVAPVPPFAIPTIPVTFVAVVAVPAVAAEFAVVALMVPLPLGASVPVTNPVPVRAGPLIVGLVARTMAPLPVAPFERLAADG